MSLDPLADPRSASPASSGRSSPVPRASRRTVEDGIYKPDKQLRRYAVGIERALASWEANPQEWADYIAFLGRLLKALQSHPKDVPILPCSQGVASRLAQCLNPSLPSGVHQKALEVYAYIFELLGATRLITHLHEFLPGLSTVLSFASLSVRPGFYTLLEDYITQLPAEELRPALKSLVLSIFPALEDETSEDFERAFNLLEKLRSIFAHVTSDAEATELKGRFWQCVFLATITSPTRRQGALNYLTRTLPNLKHQIDATEANGKTDFLLPEAREVLNPEPGLLIRCFVCGLSDPQILVQRGFLDLLVSHLPLDSPVLQDFVQTNDFDRLVTSAMQILLRRDMSLNRRLWAWFLGPEPVQDVEQDRTLPDVEKSLSIDGSKSKQLEYFVRNGKASLERSLLAMFAREKSAPIQVARPFRISLSLMDRWEIGGSVVPEILLPALQCAYRYCKASSDIEAAEVLRSANLFFDGVEAHLIWATLFGVLDSALPSDMSAGADAQSDLDFFEWVVAKFNISDDEMLSVHVPNTALYLTCKFATASEISFTAAQIAARIVTVLRTLVGLIPSRVFDLRHTDPANKLSDRLAKDEALGKLFDFYGKERRTNGANPLSTVEVTSLLIELSTDVALQTLNGTTQSLFPEVTSLLLVYFSKADVRLLPGPRLLEGITAAVSDVWPTSGLMPFDTLKAIIKLVANATSPEAVGLGSLASLEPILTAQVWERLSPVHPKHHVEAVRLFWQLDQLASDSGGSAASLTALVRTSQQDAAAVDSVRADRVRCFMTLWEHTVVPDESIVSSGKTRRGSAMPKVDANDERRHLEVLSGPLFLLLDLLEAENKRAADIVASWLGRLPSLGRVLNLLVSSISEIVFPGRAAHGLDASRQQRRNKAKRRELRCNLRHIHALLGRANDFVWQRLQETSTDPGGDGRSTVVVIGTACVELVRRATSVVDDRGDLNRLAIEVLRLLLTCPVANQLKDLESENVLIDTIIGVLEESHADLQGSLLKALSAALKVRLSGAPSEALATRRSSRASTSARSQPMQNGELSSPTATAFTPPPRLLHCIQVGFSTDSARFYLDHWILFLSDVLPIFADAIFSTLLPLVSCFCTSLDRCFNEVSSVTRKGGIETATAPQPTLLGLIDALDMVLARAHECMLDEVASEPQPKQEHNKRSQAPMAPSMFKAEAPPSKTTKANTRLTVILAFQDAVRICLSMWSWASRHADNSGEDQSSSASTVHNALKLRNRSRRLLDQIFAVEPLESIEVLMASWCQTSESSKAATSLSLLHVMNCTRPSNAVPAMFDALCSRTNAPELSSDRRSSLTCDISAPDIALFLATYLETLENDALDEIWNDCLAFLRTVSKDALPYRSVLSALLWIVLLLAEKLEKTNFGEQRKMRREIADMFQRLMSATLTTLPPSTLSNTTSGDLGRSPLPQAHSGTNSLDTDKQRLQLAPVLCHLITNLEVVTDSQDRIVALVNNITTSLLTPLFHSKAFPSSINPSALEILLHISKKAPTAKTWKKDVLDAFSDPRFLQSPFHLIKESWLPVLRQWCFHDRERMPELISRLTPPSTAGIMFGVGANAARLEADRKTQSALRRACILLLSTPADVHAAHMPHFEEKLAELLTATASSSPSSAIKSELLMLCRALTLSINAVHLAPLWPIINDTLQSALSSLLPQTVKKDSSFTNLSLLQACKLLDLLIGLSPEEFQLHEWLYITDTIDAVYQPTQYQPPALADYVSGELGVANLDDSVAVLTPPMPTSEAASTSKAPLSSNIAVDARDAKVMAKEDFARLVLRPFLSQLSIHAYESVYNLEALDVEASRDDLLRDVLDLSTMVE